jgi:hypothetical protein
LLMLGLDAGGEEGEIGEGKVDDLVIY